MTTERQMPAGSQRDTLCRTNRKDRGCRKNIKQGENGADLTTNPKRGNLEKNLERIQTDKAKTGVQKTLSFLDTVIKRY